MNADVTEEEIARLRAIKEQRRQDADDARDEAETIRSLGFSLRDAFGSWDAGHVNAFLAWCTSRDRVMP